jgi:ABC-2 type transport system ATP-binding protein
MNQVIQVENLVHRFGEKTVIDRMTFEVMTGEVVGLLGPNGAGKTTTIRLLNGLYQPTEGKMRVLGYDPASQGDEIRTRSGVLTETSALYERLTAYQNLEFFGTMAEMPKDQLKKRMQELLKFFELEQRMNDRIETFSKGMKQRLALARALLQEPALLFLDEPTSGLDPEASLQVHDLIHDIHSHNGKTVVLCTHRLEEAEHLCDRLLIMSRGRILAQGSLADLRRQHAPGLWLEIRFFQPASLELLESLKDFPGVIEVDGFDQLGTKIKAVEEAVVPQLVNYLVARDVKLLSVAPRHISLEEIYFKLQEDEREGVR